VKNDNLNYRNSYKGPIVYLKMYNCSMNSWNIMQVKDSNLNMRVSLKTIY